MFINIKRRAQTTIVANNNTCSAKYPGEVATKLAKNATGPIVLDAFKGQRTRPGKDVPCVSSIISPFIISQLEAVPCIFATLQIFKLPDQQYYYHHVTFLRTC